VIVLVCLASGFPAAAEPSIGNPSAPAPQKVITVSTDPARQAAEAGEIYVQPPSSVQPTAINRADVRERIRRRLLDHKTSLAEAGQAEGGSGTIAAVIEVLQRHGYRSMSGLSANLVREAHLLMGRQHLEKAGQSLDGALQADPLYLPAIAAQAELSLGRKPIRVPGYVTAALTGIHESFWPALTTLVDLCLALLLTLVVLSVLYLTVVTARYQKMFRHSLAEGALKKMPGEVAAVAGWCLVLAPLFVFLGPFWLFCYWTLLFWRFASRREHIAQFLALLVLSLAVPAMDTVEGTYRDLNTSDMRLFSEALSGHLLSPRGETLIIQPPAEEGSAGPPNYDQERRFVAASVHRLMGRDDQAFEQYAAIPVYHYLYAMAQNNIGNIYFDRNQFDLSIQHYRKAIDVRPDYAESFFNLSSAQFQVYDFDHSDQSLSRAQRLAPLAIGKLINEESRGLKVLDHRIPPTFLWGLVREALSTNARKQFAGFRRPLSRGGPVPLAPAALLLLASVLTVLGGALLAWMNRHEEIGLCATCGRPWCRKCGPDPMKDHRCQQCSHLDSRMSGVSPKIRRRKLRQIGRHRLWRTAREGLFALIAPGLERLRRGRTITGLLLTAVWLFLLSVLFVVPRCLPVIGLRSSPWHLDPLLFSAGVLAMLVWGLSLVGWLVRFLRSGGWRPLGSVDGRANLAGNRGGQA